MLSILIDLIYLLIYMIQQKENAMRTMTACLSIVLLGFSGCGQNQGTDQGGGQSQATPDAGKAPVQPEPASPAAGTPAPAPAPKTPAPAVRPPAMESKSAEELIETLKAGDSFSRSAAAEALGTKGDSKAVDALLAALKDKDEQVRASAAHSLGRLKDASALDGLVAALKDENRFVCANAAEALGIIGDAKSARPLVAALGHDDPDVRFWACDSLKRISGKDFGYDAAGWTKWISEKK